MAESCYQRALLPSPVWILARVGGHEEEAEEATIGKYHRQ